MPAARSFSALITACVLSGAAQAVLAPEFYEEARRSADHHVQIALTDVDTPGGGFGLCRVEGTVVQVFRGTLKPGETLTFDVACYRYGHIPDGPTLWTSYDALADAAYLEAFMAGGNRPRIALDQVAIIPAQRDRAYCDSASLACEAPVIAPLEEESCSFIGRTRAWLGLGADECRKDTK